MAVRQDGALISAGRSVAGRRPLKEAAWSGL